MSLNTDYFYRMAAPVRVAADLLGKRVDQTEKFKHVADELSSLPYGMGKDELIAYAYTQYGLVLSRKRKIDSIVVEIYKAGSES